jgi:hypothetical protein
MITPLDHCLPCFSHCIVSPSLIYAMITPLDHYLPGFAHCIVSSSTIETIQQEKQGKQ